MYTAERLFMGSCRRCKIGLFNYPLGNSMSSTVLARSFPRTDPSLRWTGPAAGLQHCCRLSLYRIVRWS